MTGFAFTPLSKDFYSIPRGEVLFRRVGDEGFTKLGNIENFSLSFETETAEIYTKQTGLKTLAAKATIQSTAALSFTATQWIDFLRAASVLGSEDALVQAAQTGSTKSVAVAKVGQVYDLGYYDVTNVSVTDGIGTETLVEGTHFRVHAPSGSLELLAMPAAADGALEITFDAPEIAADANRLRSKINSTTNLAGEFRFIGTGDEGVREDIRLWYCEIRPSGDRALLGEDDFARMEFEGDVLADSARPSEPFGINATLA